CCCIWWPVHHSAQPEKGGSRAAGRLRHHSLLQIKDEPERCHRLCTSGGRILGLIDGFEQLGFGLVQLPSCFIVADLASLCIQLFKDDAFFEIACCIG